MESQQKDAKKKRKNKKKRKSGPRQKISSDDVDNDENGVDEITRTVRLVDKMFGTAHHQHHHHHHHHQQNPIAGQSELDCDRNILHIQHKNLNPQVELKRMFGKIVNQEQQKRRRAGGASQYRSIKSVYITNPKDSWPPVNRTGLSMNLIPSSTEIASNTSNDKKTDKNLLYFSFEHCELSKISFIIASFSISLFYFISSKLPDDPEKVFGKR